MSSTLPMAAVSRIPSPRTRQHSRPSNSPQIFTRNKMIGWTSVLFSIQTWLAETPAQKEAAGSPAYFSVGMSLLAVGVAYMPLFMPPTGPKGPVGGTGTGAPAAAGS